MRQAFSILLGCIAILAGLYYSLNNAQASERQSVLQPFVASPEDAAHAREMMGQYKTQPIPAQASTWSQRPLVRPSSWPMIKHDNPHSLGNGYVMQIVYPKPGIACAVVHDGAQQIISVSGCNASSSGQ